MTPDLFHDGVRGGDPAVVAPIVVIRLALPPIGKARPRSRIVTPKVGKPFIHVYTEAETLEYEAQLRAAAIDAMRGRAIIDEPVDLLVFAYFPIPASWSKTKTLRAINGEIRPTGAPDWENVGKITDALNPWRDKASGIRVPIVWRDDAIVVDGRVIKQYAKRKPGLIIEVWPARKPPEPWRAPCLGKQ